MTKDVLASLTEEQRQAVRHLLCHASCHGWNRHSNGFTSINHEQVALNLLPEPDPVLIPLEDVLPILEACKYMSEGESHMWDAIFKFEEDHEDKLAAIKGE